MPSEIRIIRGEKVTKEIETELNRHIRRTAGVCRDIIRQTMKKGKRIDDRRRNYKPLQQSTIDMRKSRGIRRTSPMIETGNLMNAVKSKKSTGGYEVYISDRPHPRKPNVKASEYGITHMATHPPTGKFRGTKAIDTEARPFFDIPKGFYETKQYKDIEKQLDKKLEEIIKKNVRVKRF